MLQINCPCKASPSQAFLLALSRSCSTACTAVCLLAAQGASLWAAAVLPVAHVTMAADHLKTVSLSERVACKIEVAVGIEARVAQWVQHVICLKRVRAAATVTSQQLQAQPCIWYYCALHGPASCVLAR